ncbi:MAG: LarC family nickel insertion protein [Candidatus Omnitrophica bacterium]|nr:LarC family nickel insertion protein [Candidatus Omnitrophota bacterium]
MREEKVIYFDLIGGASGDMLLAGLIGAGFQKTSLENLMRRLGFKQLGIRLKKIKVGHISANRLSYQEKNTKNLSFKEIRSLFRKAPISRWVSEKSMQTYDDLLRAEEAVHGHKHHTRFEHLGKPDAIIEIAGFWLALEELKINRGFCSIFPLSQTAPATIELLKNRKVCFVDWGYETVTPTAAVLLKNFSQNDMVLIPKTAGYAAGYNNSPEREDMLRVVTCQKPDIKEKILKLETNLDDINPQVFDYIMELLFKAGALDVYITPIIMKKSRPAFVLSVLLDKKDLVKIEKVIFRETTTYGLRYAEFSRDKLNYKFIEKKTSFGKVLFRTGHLDGSIFKQSPEYSHCKKIASKYNIPLIDVYKRLNASNAVLRGSGD